MLIRECKHRWFWDVFAMASSWLLYEDLKWSCVSCKQSFSFFFLTVHSCLFLCSCCLFLPHQTIGSHRNFSFACLSTTIVARRKRASAASVSERFARCRILREFEDAVFWTLTTFEDLSAMFVHVAVCIPNGASVCTTIAPSCFSSLTVLCG